jgi:hypothetical protein
MSNSSCRAPPRRLKKCRHVNVMRGAYILAPRSRKTKIAPGGRWPSENPGRGSDGGFAIPPIPVMAAGQGAE